MKEKTNKTNRKSEERKHIFALQKYKDKMRIIIDRQKVLLIRNNHYTFSTELFLSG